jgi:uncharacterized metal-binding protein YceD (DUF177 family)
MHELSRALDLSKISKDGRELSLTLEPASAIELAKACGIEAVESLSANLLIRPWRKSGFSVRGSFEAQIVQQCVVTLEPVQETVKDDIERFFLPAEEMERFEEKALDELELFFDESDPPDPLEGTELDLFSMVSEQLLLSKSPYPRVEGANLPSSEDEDLEAEEEAEKPFAALKILKDVKKS